MNLVNGRLELDETDSSMAVTLRPTVPVSCPPCSFTVRLVNPVGLTVSTCSLTFTAEQPLSGQTVNVRAVPTAGSNSRTTRLQFHAVNTHVTGSGWDQYTVPELPVSRHTCSQSTPWYNVQRSFFWYTHHYASQRHWTK